MWLLYVFPQDISDEDFKKAFKDINEDDEVTGILLLRPLPRTINEKDIENMIDPKKDLDGISPINIASDLQEIQLDFLHVLQKQLLKY